MDESLVFVTFHAFPQAVACRRTVRVSATSPRSSRSSWLLSAGRAARPAAARCARGGTRTRHPSRVRVGDPREPVRARLRRLRARAASPAGEPLPREGAVARAARGGFLSAPRARCGAPARAGTPPGTRRSPRARRRAGTGGTARGLRVMRPCGHPTPTQSVFAGGAGTGGTREHAARFSRAGIPRSTTPLPTFFAVRAGAPAVPSGAPGAAAARARAAPRAAVLGVAVLHGEHVGPAP